MPDVYKNCPAFENDKFHYLNEDRRNKRLSFDLVPIHPKLFVFLKMQITSSLP